MSRVGWVTDRRFLDHVLPGHPERPERLTRLWEVLDETGLATRLDVLPVSVVDGSLLESIHAPDQIGLVDELSLFGGHLDPDTYVAAGSAGIARLAAGAVVGAVDAVLDGICDRAFAAVRPPGHHAGGRRSMGFCLFNNVALAAEHARRRGLARVAVVDWDVHHGNGTQDIFYGSADVLFVSTHQYPFYPGTGPAHEIGTGAGEGTTINVPLPAGVGDAGLELAFDRIVLPALRRFRPELLLVSAGFDAHHRDPLASLSATTGCFTRLAERLTAFADEACQGRVVVTLEGGYDLEAIAWGAAATVAVLLGITPPIAADDAESLIARRPEPDITPLVESLQALHGL